MSNPAFIVEGKHEQSIIKRLCGSNYPVRRLTTNGKDVPLEKIARRIYFTAKIFDNRNYPIIVILDREQRKVSAKKMADVIREHLSQNADDKNTYIIGGPDPIIEAWIIPFVDESGNFVTEASKKFESKKCLGELKKRLRKQNVLYDKTIVGTDLFCKIDPIKLTDASTSFRLFYEQARNHCSWLKCA